MDYNATDNTNEPSWAYNQQKHVKTIEIGRQCTNFTIPAGGGNALHNYPPLPSLERIILHNTIPPTLSAYFTNVQYMGDVQIMVPKGSIETYQNADGWKNFWNITEYDENSSPTQSYTLTYVVDGETYKTYKLQQGTTIIPETTPSKNGYTFSGWSEIPATMPAKDVTVTGTFIPNNVDDVDVASVEIGGVYYRLTAQGHVAEVIAGAQKYYGNVKIPATVKYKGITYSVTSIGMNAFWGCKELTSITLPNSIITIGDYAFIDAGLTSLTIPGSVTSIGEYAFTGCNNLSTVTIEDGVTNIGERAFMSCEKLETVAFPNSLEVIGPFSFSGCRQLKTIEIPNSVTAIDNGAFVQCEKLESVVLPNNLKTLGTYVFQKCYELRSVKIPSCLKNLTEGTFSYCNNLTQAEMEEGVEDIGLGVFYQCSGLSSITIPSSVKSIGTMAFQGCANLNSVTVLSKDPATLTNSSFSNASNSILHVPKGCQDVYRTASYWNAFSSIVEPYYTLTYLVDNDLYKMVDVNYGENITPEAEPTREGCIFSGWSKIPAKMPAEDVTITGSFTLVDAIEDVLVDDEKYQIYTPNGTPVETLQKGVNILHYSNGSIKKVYIK